MRVVVDTSVWSLALRRNTPSQAMPVVNQLRDLIVDGRVVLLGAVRQEVLSGIRHIEQFTRLRDSHPLQLAFGLFPVSDWEYYWQAMPALLAQPPQPHFLLEPPRTRF